MRKIRMEHHLGMTAMSMFTRKIYLYTKNTVVDMVRFGTKCNEKVGDITYSTRTTIVFKCKDSEHIARISVADGIISVGLASYIYVTITFCTSIKKAEEVVTRYIDGIKGE